jgi:hypothetical protein
MMDWGIEGLWISAERYDEHECIEVADTIIKM